MPTAENALLQFEAGQNAVAMSQLTDSGDRTTFNSGLSFWSRKSGFAPIIRPNGLLTGGAISVGSGDDAIDVASLTCNLNGVETTVAADSGVSITRPASNVSKVLSITVDSGGSIAVVAGTDGASSAFSETRDATGGPPLIPVGSIEIGQVRLTTSAAAAISASEIFTVQGLHVEKATSPTYSVDYRNGRVTFLEALPAIHDGPTPRRVYASYASAIYGDIDLATDYVPTETAHQNSSTPLYGTVVAASSATLNNGSFTAYLEDGVEDPLVQNKNETLWFRFYPDRFKTANITEQGKLGIARTYPADDNIQAACTISSETAASEASS